MTAVVLLCSKSNESANFSTSKGSPLSTSTLSRSRPLLSCASVR